MINILKQPFNAYNTKTNRIYRILWFGIFIFLFLYIFKPNFLEIQFDTQPFDLITSLGFGLITMFVLIVINFLLAPLVNLRNWTLGKSILWSIFSAVCVGIANFFAYFALIHDVEFNIYNTSLYLEFFFYFILIAIIIGVIPISLHYFFLINKQYKKTLKDAGIFDDNKDSWGEDIIIKAGNKKKQYVFNTQNIHYILSDENYVIIYHFNKETLCKNMIRGTLQAVETDLKKYSQFVRCHNRYIVNTKHIYKTDGNTQNLKLLLQKSNTKIPVSRSKAPHLLKIVTHNNP